MTTTSPGLRPELGALPARLRRLPLDPRGYPTPWFVPMVDDPAILGGRRAEFRAIDPRKFAAAIRFDLCWICGEKLGRFKAFVTGPMCAVNRTSAEPPGHRDCAIWSAQHCPFLSRPHMVRRENDIPEDAHFGDAALARNPGGCAAVYITRDYTVARVGRASASGYLLTMGAPIEVRWFAEGRPATQADVEASITSGMPTLEAQCALEPTAAQQDEARFVLAICRAAVEAMLPAV